MWVCVFSQYSTTRNALGYCHKTMMKSVDTCEVVHPLYYCLSMQSNKKLWWNYSVNEYMYENRHPDTNSWSENWSEIGFVVWRLAAYTQLSKTYSRQLRQSWKENWCTVLLCCLKKFPVKALLSTAGTQTGH